MADGEDETHEMADAEDMGEMVDVGGVEEMLAVTEDGVAAADIALAKYRPALKNGFHGFVPAVTHQIQRMRKFAEIVASLFDL